MPRRELIEERLTHSVIGAFFEVYNGLGFGFLEHLYVVALEHELVARGHRVARELCVRVMYKDSELGEQRLDMVVDDKLVVETKSTRKLYPGADRQVYNYLRATNLEVGLLLHFGPEPKFYRVVCLNEKNRAFAPNKNDQKNQRHPADSGHPKTDSVREA
ncbi:MAG: GxxExxY protein [Gemmatimonadaceae bacterium]